MQDFLNAIKEWPVIVQGALGSALFWGVSFVTQLAIEKGQKSTSAFTKKSKRRALRNERLRLSALKAKSESSKANYATYLIYTMSRPLITGLIWMVLGNIFATFMGVFSTIGYVGAFYYFLSALNIIKPIKYEGDIDDRLEEIKVKLSD